MVLSGTVLAHAYLAASTPEHFATVEAATEVVLTFTADVEPAFSHFELRRLTLPEGVWPADPTAPSEAERMRLNALVAQQLRSDDPEGTIDVTVGPARRTSEVTLAPDAPLEPGAYAVAFEVLAIDGHTTSDHLVFFVAAD